MRQRWCASKMSAEISDPRNTEYDKVHWSRRAGRACPPHWRFLAGAAAQPSRSGFGVPLCPREQAFADAPYNVLVDIVGAMQ
jgi:hypothetical protein